MLFFLSKILGFVALPSNLIALLGGAGALLLATRYRRAGARLLVIAAIALLIAGLSPLGKVLLLTLSERFPPWREGGAAPDGIIVLGGAIEPETSAARGLVELDGSAERVLEMLRLARRYPGAKVVFSGGSGNFLIHKAAEAPFAGSLLEEFGVARDRIVLESTSRTTAENAENVRNLIAPKPGERWLLVTSSFHMPRSIGVFRKAGFDVEAYPVDWRSRGWIDAAIPFDRLSTGLARTDTALHEWWGLLVYRLTGKSAELFPGPRLR